MNGSVEITGPGGARILPLAGYLDPVSEERSRTRAREWIKALRGLRFGGRSMRDRFTAGDDSLWWFTEIYLHKTEAVLLALRTIAAVDALVERERPSAMSWHAGDVLTQWVATARAATHGFPQRPRTAEMRLKASERRTRARAHALRLADGRPGTKRAAVRRATVAAFVHRAFVNPDEGAAAGERYIGRVLTALERHLPPGELQTLVVGPRRSFRIRKWWDPVIGGREGLVPIEAIGGARSARDREVWASRHQNLTALEQSDDLRRHSVIDGTDCWPLIRAQFVGVVWLQWPWSVRAMDRAGAALDVIQPRAALTYAEAGGWGRALALEARRRGIPFVGIQHGFIHRHWLNYLHEADELVPSREHRADNGFPRPALTLVFDRYAERHLIDRGHFPPSAVRVVGSAEKDALVETARGMTGSARAAVIRRFGIPDGRRIVLCATKFTEAKAVLPLLASAVRRMPAVHLIIKAHPAESTRGYAPFAAENVSIVSAAEPLTQLLAIAEAVVTVNSTVAIDAFALGLPSLTLGQPNNLSPFVEAGAMLGADDEAGIADALARLLSDPGLRASIVAKGVDLVGNGHEGTATENAARAVLTLAGCAADGTPRPC